jgi:aspartyl-tRNA(Asn)/glutamyl-tRNA(Gln) amidotransferase subunit C
LKITREDVLYVAELAHLELTEAEVDLYRGQLDSILTYIEKLKELDVENVEPMAQVLFDASGSNAPEGFKSKIPAPPGHALPADGGLNPALRDDVLRPSKVGEAVLSGAAGASKPYFRVPKVIDR